MDVFFSACPIRIPLPEGAAAHVFHPFAYSEEINQEEVSHIITTEHYIRNFISTIRVERAKNYLTERVETNEREIISRYCKLKRRCVEFSDENMMKMGEQNCELKLN
jgi:hypothetical protein